MIPLIFHPVYTLVNNVFSFLSGTTRQWKSAVVLTELQVRTLQAEAQALLCPLRVSRVLYGAVISQSSSYEHAGGTCKNFWEQEAI